MTNTIRTRRFTVERIDDEMSRVLAATSEIARLRAGLRMWAAARTVLRAAIVVDHGDWQPGQVDRELAVRMSHGLVSHVTG
jgi:hypothetical protein